MQIRIRISKWIMNPIIGLFIAMGTNNNLFTYAAVLLSLVCIVFYSSHESLGVLLFIMSFTHIFKSAPGTTSFFIILMLFYIMWNLLKRTRRFDAVVGEIIIFIAYIAVVHFASGLMRISELIKFASGFLFLYLALSMVDYNKIRDLLLSYIFGVLISSFLKVSEAFPNAVFYTNEAIELVRFTGMHGDPNYYGVNLIISMCLVVIMYHRREIPTLMAVLIVGLLVWLSTLTVSKAVFLMLVLPLCMFIYSNHANRRIWTQILMVAMIVVMVGMVLTGKIEAFNAVLKRFDIVDDAASLTSGRSVKWEVYFEHIFSNPRVLLFGEGLSAPYTRAGDGVPHNTYIDFLFYLGILGTTGWWHCTLRLFSCYSRRITRNILNISLLACVFVMWLSLSELLYFDLPFHLLLAFLIWNLPMSRTHETVRSG